jgi:hypothetical protein
MNSTRTSVVFIHDLWLHPASWQPRLGLFQDALAWPRVSATVELARAHAGSRPGYGTGYSPTIDAGWRAVADECLGWLAQQLRN